MLITIAYSTLLITLICIGNFLNMEYPEVKSWLRHWVSSQSMNFQVIHRRSLNLAGGVISDPKLGFGSHPSPNEADLTLYAEMVR